MFKVDAARIVPLFVAALVLGSSALPVPVRAEGDPAVSTIEGFDEALLASMKSGSAAGAEGRFKRLMPAVERAFDVQAMVRFAVGPQWSSFSAADQSALTRAFARLTAANLARNFSAYDGERIKVSPTVDVRGPDKLVRTSIEPKTGEATLLNYRMRLSGGVWKVIDVYYGAVSQLTAQRSDFAAAIASGGASGLLKTIQAKTDSLLKS